MTFEEIGEFAVYLVLFCLFSLLLAFPTMWLWNAVIPDLFNVRTISWIEALYLCLLTRLLWGNGGSRSSSR